MGVLSKQELSSHVLVLPHSKKYDRRDVLAALLAMRDIKLHVAGMCGAVLLSTRSSVITLAPHDRGSALWRRLSPRGDPCTRLVPQVLLTALCL